MKKISARMFFTVMWRGLCQSMGYLMSMFRYKRDGKYAKCIWGLFATSGAIIMAFFALAIVCAGVEVVYDRGLMSADGHVVTMPLYRNIEAIGYDLYLCEVSNSDKVIVNGKGEIVK